MLTHTSYSLLSSLTSSSVSGAAGPSASYRLEYRVNRGIQAKIGDIVLQAGDVLLLDTGSSFLRLYKADPAFALVSEIENSAPPQFDKLLPACGTAVVMIAVFVAGALDLFVAALLASGIMLATGCLTQNAARGGRCVARRASRRRRRQIDGACAALERRVGARGRSEARRSRDGSP